MSDNNMRSRPLLYIARRSSVWLLLTAGILIPVLSNIGYTLAHLEFWFALLILVAAMLVGAATLPSAPGTIPYQFAALLVAFHIHLHYIPTSSAAFLVILCTSLLLSLWLRDAFIFSAASASLLVVILSAIPPAPLLTQAATSGPKGPDAPRSVIHLVLDEHASPDAIPDDIIPREEVEELVSSYEKSGFQVFSNSYSPYTESQHSISHILNLKTDNPKKLVEKTSHGYKILKAETFEHISAERTMHIITPDYIDILSPLKHLKGSVGGYLFEMNRPRLAELNLLNFKDRLKVLLAQCHNWLTRRQKVEIYRIFVALFNLVEKLEGFSHGKNRLYSLIGMNILERITTSMIPNLGRGQYLYAHVLLPHYPYAYDRQCTSRPVEEWRNKTNWHGENDIHTRAERYRLYFDQVLCTRRKLQDLLKAVEANPALSDAVIILHGDHGSRIWIRNWKKIGVQGYGKSSLFKDAYGALFAVKLPGESGRRITTPFSVHDIFSEIVQSNFTKLNLNSIEENKFYLENAF